MKKSMTEYLSSMSGNNIDKLESIIKNHYKKFLRFYNILKNHSDDCKSFEYEFTSKNKLEVIIKFKKHADIDSIVKNIQTSIDDNKYDGSITNKNNKVKIILELDE